jgi:hypothetical protein
MDARTREKWKHVRTSEERKKMKRTSTNVQRGAYKERAPRVWKGFVMMWDQKFDLVATMEREVCVIHCLETGKEEVLPALYQFVGELLNVPDKLHSFVFDQGGDCRCEAIFTQEVMGKTCVAFRIKMVVNKVNQDGTAPIQSTGPILGGNPAEEIWAMSQKAS